MNEDSEIFVDEEIDEKGWLEAVSRNEVFEFLNGEAENIYTLDDGK